MPAEFRSCSLTSMLSTRALGLGPSLRRAATNSARITVGAKRFVQIDSLPSSATTDILNKQRINRPSSPHFTIYQPQITWVLSIGHRVTGVALGVLFYEFFIAYLVAPGTFSSAHVVEVVSSLPDSVKYAGKAILAAPFAFHLFNGIRHLNWDLLKALSVKAVYRSGYAVLGATAIATAYLTFFQ